MPIDEPLIDMEPDQQELVRDGQPITAVARTFNVHPATIDRVIDG